MKRLLAYDLQNNARTKLVDLLQVNKEEVTIEEAVGISDVFRKLAFGKRASLTEDKNNLLVVRLDVPDMETLDFLGYLHKSKPALRIILYTSESTEWLEKLNLIIGKPLIPVNIIVTTKINEAISKLLELKELKV
ncbi:hypothetical protein ACFP1I_16895 [Dyadobacter subterraneus]|uniref:Response regulatory domain-containing protein n=1 Tax=Dyadobacter subterraneus TaxID=2773304 RepID=A0ABR9WHG3_9BACT|nr:hypothetical protein [Dyadobacter subterraneus]MBE9464967.1 hypothetical protein [Dyadobacter subterraneus]